MRALLLLAFVSAAFAAPVTTGPDGMAHVGTFCDDLLALRSSTLTRNQTLCGRNGDLYYPQFGCFSGAQRPAGLPFASMPGLLLPASALVYPGWGGWNNQPWVYKVQAACQWGAKDPAWCSTAGCTLTSGTCTATAFNGSSFRTVQDGSCQLTRGGGDVGFSSWQEGVEGSVVFGNGMPGGNFLSTIGDNQRRSLRSGPGGYRAPDGETAFAAGGGAMSGGPDTFVLNNALHPGFGTVDTASVGVAGTPPPILATVAGTAPGTYWLEAAVAWEPVNHGASAGSTTIGPLLAAPATAGGMRVRMPERDGWTWPQPYMGGAVMAKVFVSWLPSGPPCTPYPGQTQCEVLNASKQFLIFADYLLSPSDYLDVTVPTTPEHESPPDANDSGMNGLATYDATIGFGFCSTGETGIGFPCRPSAPDTGYWYGVFSWGNDANCRHGNRGGYPITVTALPTAWRTDRLPFCGPDGTAWQRLSPHDTSNVFLDTGTGCPVRLVRPDGTFTGGYCNGRWD